MHISIPDATKKRFHAACAIRGLKMSQVVVNLVEQWLEVNDPSVSTVKFDESITRDKLTS